MTPPVKMTRSAMATMPLKHGIERLLREVIDNDIVVEQVK